MGLADQRGGFDHCYVVRGEPESLRPAARVVEPDTGRTLALETTQPGLQLYTGNFLDGSLAGRGGIAYGRWHAFCLEPQGLPDAPNQPGFAQATLEPGATYSETAIFRFGTDAEEE